MNHTVTVTGMVLTAAPIGDYDKRVVLLTKELGKISAFAKGARRQNSPVLAAATPFSFGEFTLYEGRTSYNIMQAAISNYFMEIKEDFSKICYGSYFLEFAEYYTTENNDETQMLKLVYQTMRALGKDTIPNELIRYIFELKVFVINGEYPQVFECQNCGRKEDLCLFDLRQRGVFCNECISHSKNGTAILPSALYAMQFIISESIQKLYTFTLKEEAFTQLKQMMDRYRSQYVDKNFKSLAFLEL